jgi:hypothetical protein
LRCPFSDRQRSRARHSWAGAEIGPLFLAHAP